MPGRTIFCSTAPTSCTRNISTIDRLELTGEPIQLLENALGFGSTTAGVNVSASLNGVLAYRAGAFGGNLEMAWFDRSGRRLSSVGSPAQFSNPALSPDEKSLAVGRIDPQLNTRDLWIYDLVRGTSTRLTFDPGDDLNPVWSPDGKRIAFSSTRKGAARDMYITDANGIGEAELVLQSALDKHVEQWSPDGKYLLYNSGTANGQSDVFVLPVSVAATQSDRIPQLPFNEDMAQISPNGKWIAYRSNESGVSEVYVQDFVPNDPASRRKWRVSTDGGVEPYWRADGKELFYLRNSDFDGGRGTTEQKRLRSRSAEGAFLAGVARYPAQPIPRVQRRSAVPDGDLSAGPDLVRHPRDRELAGAPS